MAGKAPLLDYSDALDAVLAAAAPMEAESVALVEVPGRVLAEPVRSAHDMPFFDNSAVDGYALTAEDARREGAFWLPLAGTLRAGADPTGVTLAPGAAIKVLTGAAVPEGAATMVMQEDTEAADGGIRFVGPLPLNRNIRRRGEEFHKGDEILPAGVLATPAVVAAIAAAGLAMAIAYRRPRIGVLVTGDELLPPGEPLLPGRIYESNFHGLAAALRAMGFDAPLLRRAPDEPAATRAMLSDLLEACDVVLTSGGVSVGEFDAIKPALADLGVETIFWGLAIKPGKPFYFGRKPGGAAVFGLPGNPVAAMVTFHTLARPFLLRSMGLDGRPRVSRARLVRDLKKKPGRLEFVPCRVADGEADPEVKRGSHMLGALALANALVLFPKEAATLSAGDTVEVISLKGSVV